MKILMRRFFAGFIIVIILVGIAVAGICGYVGYQIWEQTPELELELFDSTDSTIIYDQDGQVITELGVYIRENISYDDMSTSIIDAFVAVEDSRYFEHFGFDIPRFTKAIFENLKTLSFSQGGSTFTMQLVKNTYFQVDDDENSTLADKTIERKVMEIFLALDLETQMDKETIFEKYLNKLNFGSNIRGVEKASEYYFGKSASEVTLSEAALLAGIINLPNQYNPYYYLDYATTRRDEVLDLMLYHGYIDETECALAKSIKVEDLLSGISSSVVSSNSTHQSYVDAVVDEVYALTGQDPYTTPMKIYTYMDSEIQDEIEKIQNGEYEEIQFENDLKQIAMITIDNQTGAILGIGGGRDYEGERVFNRATDMYMQPGSSVKPFLNYALAFEYLGWATTHVVTDQPIVYRGTDIPIYNFNKQFYGDVTLQYAHGLSLNTPVIQSIQEVADLVGADYIVEYLQSLGFSKVTESNFDLGFAIGGSSFTTSPKELAGAHGMLMNEGYYIQPHTIQKIEFENGDEYIAEYEEVQVLSAEAAYLASTLTKDSVETNYGNYMQILQSPYTVYGKTGTSDWGEEGSYYNIPEGAAKDRWMVASTTQHTTVIWEGFDQGVLDEKTWLDTEDAVYNIRGKALRIILDTLYQDEEDYPETLSQPEGVETITHVRGTWPYASTADGVGTSVTGLIKSEFNEVVSIYSTTPSLTGVSIVANRFDDGSYRVDFSGFAYQDDSGTWKRNFVLEVPDLTITATGNVYFDYSWIYGTPKFYVTVYQNGVIVNETSGENSTVYGWLDPSVQGSLTACGYFQYENGGTSSQTCTDMN